MQTSGDAAGSARVLSAHAVVLVCVLQLCKPAAAGYSVSGRQAWPGVWV
jgi:hypothetical protein